MNVNVDRRTHKDTAAGPPGWRVEGAPPRKGRISGFVRRMTSRETRRWRWAAIIALLVLNWIIADQTRGPEPRPNVPYTFFREQVKTDNVAEVISSGDQIEGTFRVAVLLPDLPDGPSSTQFETRRPAFADDELLALLVKHKVVVNAQPPDEGRGLWQTLLFGFGPTILLVGLFLLFLRPSSRLGMSGLGRSRAKRYQLTGGRTTFDDVAGIEEAEEELREIVDFLRNPGKYLRLGGRIPKGVLLSGPPGTGKTLLARAVAGEANVPFFSLSASEFVEMVVGVGASRVRDLFEQAKKAAPAIIFIDELDAIGRSRSGGPSLSGHDEREQTLNQILTEMDGFSGSEGVIVIGATNRPEILDTALLRPGRFDRRVTVNPPDQRGRRLILEVHTRWVALDSDADLDALASSTPGMVGADLANLVNEAALTAARRSHERVTMADFTEAFEKILLGAERKIMVSAEERERTAYHEAGHALLGMLQPGADRVRKISIVPRGISLGVTFQAPDTDRYGYSSSFLRGRIISSLGGRAAEELVYGDVTTGAESDLEQVTNIARRMVGRWGMSEAVGPVSVLPGPQVQSPFFPGAGDASEATRQLVDAEVRRIIDECHEEAISQLRLHRDKFEALAQALLERETLDEEDAYQIAGIERQVSTVGTPDE